jgi:DNA-binding MarR family transcriptional regulator
VTSSENTIKTFNRLYSAVLNFLERRSPSFSLSLPEARVLIEIYYNKECTAGKILRVVKIDKGHLSRVLARLNELDLTDMKPSSRDKRSVSIQLTPKGKTEVEGLNQMYEQKLAILLQNMTIEEKNNLVMHMSAIMGLLEPVTDAIGLN